MYEPPQQLPCYSLSRSRCTQTRHVGLCGGACRGKALTSDFAGWRGPRGARQPDRSGSGRCASNARSRITTSLQPFGRAPKNGCNERLGARPVHVRGMAGFRESGRRRKDLGTTSTGGQVPRGILVFLVPKRSSNRHFGHSSMPHPANFSHSDRGRVRFTFTECENP